MPPVPPAPPANLQGHGPARPGCAQNWYDGQRAGAELLAGPRQDVQLRRQLQQPGGVRVLGLHRRRCRSAPPATSTAVVNRINCEHSIPQSWFNSGGAACCSDMHHLLPHLRHVELEPAGSRPVRAKFPTPPPQTLDARHT
ncbi:MAG: hypothetical protein WKG07_24535 [Hymenobacter sp.]